MHFAIEGIKYGFAYLEDLKITVKDSNPFGPGLGRGAPKKVHKDYQGKIIDP